MNIFLEVCGWVGTVLIVLAYLLVSFKKVDGTSRVYQWMNLTGAVALGINVFYKEAWAVLALEVVWGAIAVFALSKSVLRSKSPAKLF